MRSSSLSSSFGGRRCSFSTRSSRRTETGLNQTSGQSGSASSSRSGFDNLSGSLLWSLKRPGASCRSRHVLLLQYLGVASSSSCSSSILWCLKRPGTRSCVSGHALLLQYLAFDFDGIWGKTHAGAAPLPCARFFKSCGPSHSPRKGKPPMSR